MARWRGGVEGKGCGEGERERERLPAARTESARSRVLGLEDTGEGACI